MRKNIGFLIALLAMIMSIGLSAQEKQYPDILKKIEESGDFAPMFPFQPTHDAPQNITNVAFWPSTDGNQAGATGFITAKGEEFKDALGNTKRFLGTNICFSGNFPTHADAERVAEELARYGINVVRLHYVHHQFPPDKIYPKPNSFIEPKQLERFDYLFAKLKEKGIYTYFQLNIARKFGEQNGFENASKLPHMNHGVDNIVEMMITLQKHYHYEILNHKNPYTGLKYKDEPAIAMLELANENSIIYSWFTPRYRFPDLVEPYASYIKKLWNSWLSLKYDSTEALKQAWVSGLEGDGTEYIPDGIINTDKPENWLLQIDNVAKAEWSALPATSKDNIKGKYFVRLNVQKQGGTLNMPQFSKTGFKFKNMEPMCLKLKMRADRPVEAKLRFSQDHAPWAVAGFNTTVSLTKKWQEFEFNFSSNMDDDGIRMVLSGLPVCSVDIADMSLVSGMSYVWPNEQNLEEGTIDWPNRGEWSLLPKRAFDFTEFLAGQEAYYFANLYSHLKVNLRAPQPATGTQRNWGFDLPQAKMDYVDYHSYWNHPVFPSGRVWDGNLWNVGTGALVNGEYYPATLLTNVAHSRIWGRPLTISEYDCPSLNLHSAEGNLIASALGAFQNWGGIVQFAWTHDTNFFRDVLNTMYDMCSATQKLVHFPACHAMFVRGDVSKGSTEMVYSRSSSLDKDVHKLAITQSPFQINSEKSNLLKHLPLTMVAGKQMEEMPELFDVEGRTVIRTEDDVPQHIKDAFANGEVKSSSGELTWNWQVKGSAFFKVDTKNTKVFTGFVKGRSFEYDGMLFTPGKTRLDWLTFSMTSTNPEASGEIVENVVKSGTYLVALTGLCHNTDAVYVDLGGGRRISNSAAYGGSVGHTPILCEGINADLKLSSLAGRVECHALDGGGNRMGQVKVSSDADGNAVVAFSPEYKTVWYELIIK